MTLTPKQKRFLRARAHTLNPVVMTGNAGLSSAVLNEIEQSLSHHELIKIKLGGTDRAGREQMAATICQTLGATAIQSIGHILIIYRPAAKPQIALPKSL